MTKCETCRRDLPTGPFGLVLMKGACVFSGSIDCWKARADALEAERDEAAALLSEAHPHWTHQHVNRGFGCLLCKVKVLLVRLGKLPPRPENP